MSWYLEILDTSSTKCIHPDMDIVVDWSVKHQFRQTNKFPMHEIKVFDVHSALSFLHLVLRCFIAQNSTYSNPACEHEATVILDRLVDWCSKN